MRRRGEPEPRGHGRDVAVGGREQRDRLLGAQRVRVALRRHAGRLPEPLEQSRSAELAVGDQGIAVEGTSLALGQARERAPPVPIEHGPRGEARDALGPGAAREQRAGEPVERVLRLVRGVAARRVGAASRR